MVPTVRGTNLRGGASSNWNGLFGFSCTNLSGHLGASSEPSIVGKAGSGLLGLEKCAGELGEAGEAGAGGRGWAFMTQEVARILVVVLS